MQPIHFNNNQYAAKSRTNEQLKNSRTGEKPNENCANQRRS